MDISEREKNLFEEWKKKYPNETFVIDGAPCPESFENSPAKCLIILKDVNVDPKDEKTDLFDLRKQLASEKPHNWWRTVANWCAGISCIHEGRDLSWNELQKEDIRQSLKPFSFMQLKKTTGGGSVETNDLRVYADSDKAEIKTQIDIYRPKMIICCGVGDIVANIFGEHEWQHTRRGVRYTTLSLDGQQTFLIDYMHPSARAAKNIVCYGILDAYREIVIPNPVA